MRYASGFRDDGIGDFKLIHDPNRASLAIHVFCFTFAA